MRLPVPPWLVRRAVLAPAMPLLAVLGLLIGPLVALGSLVPALAGRARWRPVRVWLCATVYLLLETAALVAALLLWLATGLGRWVGGRRAQAAHRWLLWAFLTVLLALARRVLGFRLEVEEPAGPARALLDPAGRQPVIVLARHAGPGASFVLVHLLMSGYRRVPRIVLTDRLRWDPAIDVVLGRLGAAFIPGGSGAGRRAVAGIRRLAGGLGPRDALLIFPEGGNFTPLRHRRALHRLRRRGFAVQAEQARKLRHVLPPRPAGALAAMDAAPGAGVLVFAHTGLDDLRDVPAVWRALPLRVPLRMAWWPTPPGALPGAGDQQRVGWLLGCWRDVDAWVDEQRMLLAI